MPNVRGPWLHPSLGISGADPPPTLFRPGARATTQVSQRQAGKRDFRTNAARDRLVALPSTHEKLPRAPIMEASIEFRVSPDAKPEALSGLRESVEAEYPIWQEQTDTSARLEVSSAGVQSSHRRDPAGFVAWTAARNRCVAFGVRRFAFSQLHPYDDWETLRCEARSLWCAYLRARESTTVTRVGVRFINRILLPRDARLEDYFSTYPKIAEPLPQHVTNLLMRLEMPRPEQKALIVITQAIEKVPRGETVPIIFDIDAVHTGGCAGDDEAPWEIAETLRNLKNDAFFGSVTERTLEMYR